MKSLFQGIRIAVEDMVYVFTKDRGLLPDYFLSCLVWLLWFLVSIIIAPFAMVVIIVQDIGTILEFVVEKICSVTTWPIYSLWYDLKTELSEKAKDRRQERA